MRGSFFANQLITLRTADQTDEEEQDDCPYDRDQYAGKVEAGDALRAEETHDPATQKRADNANHDVGKRAHSLICPHNHACDPAREGSEDDPY